jgi:hypothetical protein
MPPNRRMTMNKFTTDNTDGFTFDELDILNDAFDMLQAAKPGVDDSNLCDDINNSWQTGMTADELFEAAAKRS